MKAEHEIDSVEKVWKLAQRVKVAMLTLHDGDGLHARPMESLIPDTWESIWFITDRHSPKVAEAGRRMDALLTYSTGEHGDHLVMNGILNVVEDREKLRAFWNRGAEMYFPKGPNDPAVVLLRFDPILAEYWTSGTGSVRFALQYAKTKLTGVPANLGDHARVTL